jgi:hypothetical protein
MGSLGMNTTGSAGKLRFNGDTANNYSNTILYGTGSAAGSFRESNGSNIRIYGAAVGPVANANNDNTIIHIQNYSNTTTNKTVLVRSNIPASETIAIVGMWRSTTAITSLNIASYNGTDLFTVGTTFSLYGIAATSVGAKATGGDIYSDASYYYHVFDANGTFTPTQSISADVLAISGGGGGGGHIGGGGGAGGLLAFTSQSLTATNYTVTIGAGGNGGSNLANGAIGSSSQFGALTAPTGGGYGANNTNVGGTGGSGGGGGGQTYGSVVDNNGAATSGQGFAGGDGYNVGGGENSAGGGGGGSGAVGANSIAYQAGAGGAGSTTYSTWLSATGLGVSGYIAAGGGGGADARGSASPAAGGTGGGGAGVKGNPATATAGTANNSEFSSPKL